MTAEELPLNAPALLEPLCLFSRQGQALAVGLEHVEEVIEVGELVRVPLCPPFILGFHLLRREIVPLVRLSMAQEQEGTNATEASRTALIFRDEHGSWGLPIDREGVEIVEPEFSRLKDSKPSEPKGFAKVLGDLEWKGRLHPVLDPEHTWNRLRQEVECWYRLIQGQVESSDSQWNQTGTFGPCKVR